MKTISTLKNFMDWLYYTTYDSNVKVGNPEIYTYSYLSFLYTNLSFFIFNVVCIIFKIKAVTAIFPLMLYLLILLIIYSYYNNKKQQQIRFRLSKYDKILNNIIFIALSILSICSYMYVVENC